MYLMTTLEVANYLRVKERTVYEMVSRQQIPCSRATGKLLFSRALIDAWIEANTEMPTGAQLVAPPIYAGSSDPLLEWSLRQSGAGLAVLSQGSQNGLERMASGEAVLTGIHIRDAETGLYNLKSVKNTLPQSDIVVIHWARRTLGLIVASGNPHQITGLKDLTRPDIATARRIPGAGSMVLLRDLLERELRKTAAGTARGLGCRARLRYRRVDPVLVNSRESANKMNRLWTALISVGAARKLRVGRPIMGGEDFAWYLKRLPGCFAFLSAAPRGGPKGGVHSPLFTVDERAMRLGIALHISLALEK